MKKYVKPEAKKVEIDADILRMFTNEGFKDLFWETLREAIKTDPAITHEAVFNSLNDKWFHTFGSFRYSTYDSFRQRLNK